MPWANRNHLWVGHPIERTQISDWADNPRGFMSWLRAETLKLGLPR